MVRLVPDAGVGRNVVGSLQLAGAHRGAGKAIGHAEPRALDPDLEHGYELVALEHLDHDARGAGQRPAPLRDHPHDGGRVEPRRRHRLLHLDDRLEQLGVEPHLLLGELALGDVELGAEVADLPALLVAERLPRAGAPADLAGARDHPVLLVAERAALRQPLPLGQQRRAIVGMDVLEELLVAQVLRRLAGEALEGGVHQGQPQVHVVGDHPFAHGGGDRAKLPQGRAFRTLRPTPPAPLHQPGREQRHQHDGADAGGDDGGDLVEGGWQGRDHGDDPRAAGRGTGDAPED